MYVDFGFLAANLALKFYCLTFEILEFFRAVLKICGLRYLLLLGRLSRCCPDIYPNGTLLRGKYTYILTLGNPGDISIFLAFNISLFEGEEFMLAHLGKVILCKYIYPSTYRLHLYQAFFGPRIYSTFLAS